MLIYFRKVNGDKEEDKHAWKEAVIRDINRESIGDGSPVGKLIKKGAAKEKRIYLYYVEKGDDVYGVFSYTIAKLAVLDLGNREGEVIIPPSSDREWDDEAKYETYRLIAKGYLNGLGFDRLLIHIDKNAASEKLLLEKCGFFETERGEDLTMAINRKMKIMVSGVNSELGFEVIRELHRREAEVLGCDTDIKMDTLLAEDEDIPYIQLDITDERATKKVIYDFAPDAVINGSAWSDVDNAELPENQKAVYSMNVEGTKNLAGCCRKINAKMMLLSSDYVFDGSGSEPWGADCKAYAPLNYYGKTKAEAEIAISSILSRFFVLRTEWTFGRKSRNFVDLLLEFGKVRNEITVVDDQIGIPTYFHDLARLVADMIESDKYGFYNVTNSGSYVSRNEYAKEIFRQAFALGHHEYGEEKIRVESVCSDEYRLSKAIRPFNSRLDINKLEEAGFQPLPDWKDALRRYLEICEF